MRPPRAQHIVWCAEQVLREMNDHCRAHMIERAEHCPGFSWLMREQDNSAGPAARDRARAGGS